VKPGLYHCRRAPSAEVFAVAAGVAVPAEGVPRADLLPKGTVTQRAVSQRLLMGAVACDGNRNAHDQHRQKYQHDREGAPHGVRLHRFDSTISGEAIAAEAVWCMAQRSTQSKGLRSVSG
jgi:hypothetical protein